MDGRDEFWIVPVFSILYLRTQKSDKVIRNKRFFVKKGDQKLLLYVSDIEFFLHEEQVTQNCDEIVRESSYVKV